MSVDYDLVIIGNTIAGFHAALQAAQSRARVALVQQGCQPQFSRHSALSTLGNTFDSIERMNALRVYADPIKTSSLSWAEVNGWIDAIAQDQQELYSPTILASIGVEFIEQSGEFCRKPQSGFVVNGRVLRSRAFLIATRHRPRIPEIDGLQTLDYLTSESPITHLPKSLAIVSHSSTGAELAQTYARLGTEVTLVVNQPQIIPNAEPEVAFLLQATLETEGVRILSGKIMQIRTADGKKIIQIGNQTIETDEILLAMGWESELATLNLEAMDVRLPMKTNARLQTNNPRVYYCGSFEAAVAKYEAAIAVKNALFFPRHNARYSEAAKIASTDPEIAWIGLTESQAIQNYGKDVVVLRRSFTTLLKPQLRGKTTGLCKLIVRRNGQILGAHIVGLDAGESLSALAIAIQHKIKLQQLQTAFPSPTLSEMIGQLATDWKEHRSQRNTFLQDSVASFLAWRRSISK
ncbi:MAG: NAD(P)/FAD-dependent oxidoreductase [Myxacorys californica WJT36-NPBG1]|jgi:pyruvate/2-oxoglutarate dehydrogenase complex dihydrolipoamide dehydrogenase (E3) component|nr:NAD(P)/FAD-dependent oxidoreductase [Myxacorys californica WJT36-NPBG1]